MNEAKMKRKISNAPKQTLNKKQKMNQQRIQPDSLPEEVLIHIGKSVLELVGVDQFVKLTRTSKHIHTILMNEEIRAGFLESENERIFQRVFSCGPTATKASTLEEMALCQNLANRKLTKGLIIDADKSFEDDENFVYMIEMLRKHPSAVVVLDTYDGRFLTAHDVGCLITSKIRNYFSWSFVTRHVRFRNHGSSIRTIHIIFTSRDPQGKGRVEFGFRIGGVQLPPPTENGPEEELV